MQAFSFQTPDDIAAAIKNFDGQTTRYLAGGTTLVDLLKLHVERPARLIDLSQLKLKTVRDGATSIKIGALVSNAELAQHPAIKKHTPLLSQAILAGASPQLRNLATTGGNILQKTRCSYFRDTTFACNKRNPGSGCAAIDGVNRGLAVLGVSGSCIASNPSDMNVALAALDARIYTQTTQQKKSYAFAEFYKLPGDTPHIETSLTPGELITEIEIPKAPWFAKSIYLKVRDRASYSFALTSAAIALDVHKGVIRDSRIALGGVGAIPWRSHEAESVLKGQKLSDEMITKAATAALADAKPRSGNKFKVKLAQNTLELALKKCGGLS